MCKSRPFLGTLITDIILTKLFPPEFCSSKYRWEIRHEGNRGKNFDKNFFRAVDNEFNRVLKSLYISVEYVRAQKF